MTLRFYGTTVIALLFCTANSQAQQPTAVTAPAGVSELSVQRDVFGRPGTLVISADSSLNGSYSSYSAPSGASAPKSEFNYLFGPALDYFVFSNSSIGMMLQFGRVPNPSSIGFQEDVVRVSPRLGYYFALVQGVVGLWPKAEFSYLRSTFVSHGDKGATLTRTIVGLSAPIVMHPTKHLNIGFGPFFETDLSSSYGNVDELKQTTIGMRTEIGGWWLL